ncbi:MAG: DUF481 domain-containing protein [Sulfurimonas sp.]|nr:DUF481 domain-containing protein [Sulfurimonas sp.]MDQ7060605.1 DUF481 domain-containing protein [Sulfurimonas sp.]
MRYLFLLTLIVFSLYAEELENTSDLIQLKDTSGLSDFEVRDKAEKADNKKKQSISLKQIYEITDANGSVNIKRLQALWEDQTPKTNGYDWVKAKSGEWFKGKIKAMYNDALEFDSDEIGLYTFDFDDIAYIKSHGSINVNIEKVASISGIVRFDGQKIKIIQGDKDYEFERSAIVSFAPAGERERNFWSGKVSIAVDKRTGNKNQFDFTSQLNLQRRTDATRLSFDYLGRISSVEGDESANDHRITETFDVYITKRFYWTPLFSEYYTDKFQNIKTQLTASIGLGYTLIDKRKLSLDLSGGPGILYTRYDTVELGQKSTRTSPSFETRIKLDYEFTKKSDIVYDYKFTFTDNDSGFYKHHMVLRLENELTSWLDLDLSLIWDKLAKPTESKDGTLPYKDDYQMLIGLGVEF